MKILESLFKVLCRTACFWIQLQTSNFLLLIVYTACVFAVAVAVIVTRIARDALKTAIEENGGDTEALLSASETLGATDDMSEVRQPLIVRVDMSSNGSDGQPTPVHKSLDAVL